MWSWLDHTQDVLKGKGKRASIKKEAQHMYLYFKVYHLPKNEKQVYCEIVLGPTSSCISHYWKLTRFPSLWMWLPSKRSVVCVNIHELGQIHSASEILVNSYSKAWSNEHWVASYVKIYIHIDNLNWYSLLMNIYGTIQNITEKEGHSIFF